MNLRWLSGLILSLSLPLFAQENRLKIEDVKKESTSQSRTEVGDDEDEDELITNNLLRAESGSKSRWSIASSFVYNGGTVERPLAAARPNIADTTGTTDVTHFEGQISGKLKLSKQSSWLAGVGIRWIAPFEQHVPRDYDGERFDADNPYLIYQYLYKWGGVQSVLQIQPVYYTNANLKNLGYVGSLTFDQENMIDIPDTRLSLGLALWAQLGYFNKSGSMGTPGEDDYISDVGEKQSDYQFGLDPALEYAFNDRYNFRWVCNLWNLEHLRSEAKGMTFHLNNAMQSMGVGISVTRDIYVYPNVQFFFEDLRADQTNVAINSNINLF